MKECKVCNEEKELTDYYTRKRSVDGRYHTCKECYKEKVRNRHDKERQRDYDLQRNFGITVDEYDHMLHKQDNCCAICGKHQLEFKRRFDVDHNHETGEVRGLLCYDCNPGLGKFKDNPKLLRAAADYLEANGHYG